MNEKLEIKLWADFLKTHENPIFQDLASFLYFYLNNDEEREGVQSQPHYRELFEAEILAAAKLANFFSNHSNDLLREGAYWIPQWVEVH